MDETRLGEDDHIPGLTFPKHRDEQVVVGGSEEQPQAPVPIPVRRVWISKVVFDHSGSVDIETPLGIEARPREMADLTRQRLRTTCAQSSRVLGGGPEETEDDQCSHEDGAERMSVSLRVPWSNRAVALEMETMATKRQAVGQQPHPQAG